MKLQIIVIAVIAVLSAALGALVFAKEKEVPVPVLTQFQMPEVTTDLKVISINSKNFKQHVGDVDGDDYNVIFAYDFIYELGYKMLDHKWCHELDQTTRVLKVNKPKLEFLNKQFNPSLDYLGGLTKEPKMTNLYGPIPNDINALEIVRNEVKTQVYDELNEIGTGMQKDAELNQLGERALKGLIMEFANFSGPGITKIEFKQGCE